MRDLGMGRRHDAHLFVCISVQKPVRLRFTWLYLSVTCDRLRLTWSLCCSVGQTFQALAQAASRPHCFALIAMPVHAKGSDALFEVERRLCVKGGRLKGWITLPVIEVDGRECVMVSARSSFLTNMAFSDTAEQELTKLCAEVRDLLLSAEGLTETA